MKINNLSDLVPHIDKLITLIKTYAVEQEIEGLVVGEADHQTLYYSQSA